FLDKPVNLGRQSLFDQVLVPAHFGTMIASNAVKSVAGPGLVKGTFKNIQHPEILLVLHDLLIGRCRGEKRSTWIFNKALLIQVTFIHHPYVKHYKYSHSCQDNQIANLLFNS